MDYENSAVFQGNPDKALDCARTVLMNQNFRVTSIGRSEIQGENDSVPANNRQNPLSFISRISITATGSTLSIEAEFGTYRKFMRLLALLFLLIILPMEIFTCVALTFAVKAPAFFILLISLSLLGPWPIIFPVISITIRSKARKALDTLLHNIAESAR